jgi:hypothetical protein
VRVLSSVLAVVLLAGCGTAQSELPEATPPALKPWTGSPNPAMTTGGWEVTVYYTAVEDYHDGEAERVTGCPKINCARGDQDLGSFPWDFVAAVKSEGTGLTNDGLYLNWSYGVGYWLDTAPRAAAGNPLKPYVSAAADRDVLARGTLFRIAGCGRQDDGSAVPKKICAALTGAGWRIDDEFTPGLGGRKHVDAYIGNETGPGFTDSDWYITLVGATLRMG